jgi:signal transduction histidine kinase
MSAQMPIAATAEAGSPRVRVGRMAIVSVIYVAMVVAAAIYPLVSPVAAFRPVTAVDQIVGLAEAGLWLISLLVSMARNPSGRLWKLILAWVAFDNVYALTYVPASLAWSIARPLEVLAAPVFIHLLLAFPSGRLRDRFDRGFVGFTYAFAVTTTVLQHLVWPYEGACNLSGCIRNLLAIWPNWALFDWLGHLQQLALLVLIAPLLLVGLWRHWRDATAAGRRALLPIVVAVPVLALFAALDHGSYELGFEPGIDFFNSSSGQIVRLLTPLILPLGLLLAIIQSRMSRSRVADLVVELGRGVPVGGLRDVLARSLRDPTLQLAFAAPSGDGFVDAIGQPIELPDSDASRTVARLEREGDLLGILIHDPQIDAEDPGLVTAVGNAAWLALENERLAAEVRAQLEEVRASRARIVEAADAERRRVERDLHDGAQQRLVALAMRLQVSKASTPGAAALLDEATTELETAIGEVRGLARGIHPTILTEAGLGEAVEALAERTPVPVTVDIEDRRFDRQTEATAYFVIAEALTNVARYAAATEARVTAVERDGLLLVTIRDDGRGGADPAAGSGLRGLADRLAAVGGQISVSSPSGQGTTVGAEIPLMTEARRAAAEAIPAESPTADVPGTPGRPMVFTPSAGRLLQPANPALLMTAVAALIGLVAVGVALLTLGPKPPMVGRADTFMRPFYYQVPGDSGIRLYPGPADADVNRRSDHLHVFATSPLAGEGMSVWVVEDVLARWCSGDEPHATRSPGVDGLLQYLRSIPRLDVHGETAMTVDRRPAKRVDLTVRDAESGCPDDGNDDNDGMALWQDAATPGTKQPIWIGDNERVRLIMVDVDGATVVFEIWSRVDFEAWLPTAEGIVGSVGFLDVPATESEPANSPSAP